MTGDEIRKAFLSFFESRGHQLIPSSSLIPRDDPTLLLTNAGMVQIKPYFLGEMAPPAPRLTSCQKCFRATDIEKVGNTTHNTFFEMLGNFSIGDYFKEEAINWGWDFVTRQLQLPAEHLWITIYLDDDQAFNIWRMMGIPEQRIIRYGEEHNFWGPAGDSGPCGPDSEIFYDFGPEIGCGKTSCAPDCDCGRFIEIWNLVFIQYDQDIDGNRTLLPRPCIDTGMGLERTAAVLQGKTSIYETDLFMPLIDCVVGLSGKSYGASAGTDTAIRIVTEHSRGITFLIGDGVMPSNEGRGYVLRRLLRRAALFGRKLGLDKPFLTEPAQVTINQLASVYPEIRQRQEFILKVIGQEEARFTETLSVGLELIEDIMAKQETESSRTITGEDAFRLYDTYGFPIELTTEIAEERGFSVELKEFEAEMEKQRERAKATQKFTLADREVTGINGLIDIKSTTFTGYDITSQETSVLSIIVDGDSVGNVIEGQEAGLVLRETPFYGEMGGQVGDTGEIRGTDASFIVDDTIRIPSDITVHQGRVKHGSFGIADVVTAIVDGERRMDITRNHTATHLLQMALRQVLGEHVQQRGSMVAPDQLRFDFTHLIAMSKEEISQVQRIVNEAIRHNLPVYDQAIPYKEAIEEGAIALFEEKYGDVVRALKIGSPSVSTELCGGTHVSTTGEIGFFHIISESSIGSGLRRIEAITGRGAEEYIERSFADWGVAARSIGATLENVTEKISGLVDSLDTERKLRQIEERKRARQEVDRLLNQVTITEKGVNVLSSRVDSFRPEILREITDMLRDQLKSAVVVLGTIHQDKPAFVAMVTDDLVDRGYHAGNVISQVAAVAGGGGGGKATMAQAGGKFRDKIDAALQIVVDLVEKTD